MLTDNTNYDIVKLEVYMGKHSARTVDGYSANELKQLSVAKLDGLDFLVWVNNTGKLRAGNRLVGFGKKGSADVIGFSLKTGRFVGFEVKTQYDKLSPDQAEFLYKLKMSGGYAYVIESEQVLNDALAEIRRLETVQ